MSRQTIRLSDALEDYLWSVSSREPPLLAELREETAKLPRAMMQISAIQGQFMATLAKAVGARKALEVGVFTGYSSLAVALALPADGKLVALDTNEEWTAVARRYWERAGVADRIELIIAPAAETMARLIDEGQGGSFDLLFIDADKSSYPVYWERGLELLRPGGVVLVDNVLFSGWVEPTEGAREMAEYLRESEPEERADMELATRSIRNFNHLVHEDPRVDLCMLPLGDGITFAVKR